MSETPDSEDEPECQLSADGRPVALEPLYAAMAAPIAGPTIETRRLVLRRPQVSDAMAISALADNIQVARSLIGLPHPYRPEHALAWIVGNADDMDRGQKHLVSLKLVGRPLRPIGVATLTPDASGRPPRVGCWFGESFWGRGYATEACHALVDFAFLHQGYDRLSFTCRVTNPGGRRVIEKCGFQMIAQELARLEGDNGLVPVDRFGIDRRMWSSLRDWEPLRLADGDAWGDTKERCRGR